MITINETKIHIRSEQITLSRLHSPQIARTVINWIGFGQIFTQKNSQVFLRSNSCNVDRMLPWWWRGALGALAALALGFLGVAAERPELEDEGSSESWQNGEVSAMMSSLFSQGPRMESPGSFLRVLKNMVFNPSGVLI